jgi:AcrR family transcriptional regulator
MDAGQKNRNFKSKKREAILQAAWGLIRHYGYTKTTVDDIAQKAQVGKGTVYLHFQSKAEIMLALVELTNERIVADLEKIAKETATPEDRLRRCLCHRVLSLFDIVNKYPHGSEISTSMLPEIVRRLDRYVQRHGELLGQILAQGQTTGSFKVADPQATGQMLAKLFEHFTPPYYRFRSRKSLEKFANQTMDLILTGLQRNGSAGERT